MVGSSEETSSYMDLSDDRIRKVVDLENNRAGDYKKLESGHGISFKTVGGMFLVVILLIGSVGFWLVDSLKADIAKLGTS